MKLYLQYGIYLGFLLLAIDIAVFIADNIFGAILFTFVVFYFILTLILYFNYKPVVLNELVSFATEYGQIQRKLLRDLDIPYALLDDTGKVIWTNTSFESVTHQSKGFNKSITSIFPTITRDRLPDENGVDETQYELEHDGMEYMAKFKKVSLKDMVEHNNLEVELKTTDLYSEIAENAEKSPFSEAASIQTYYESMWLARGLNIKYIKFHLPHEGLLEEPNVEIELDDYRSYHRSKRSSLETAK